MTADVTDKSLLRCTIKKSASVIDKLVLWGSYAVVGLAAAALTVLGVYGAGTVLVVPVLTALYGAVVGALLEIPWYVYAGAGIIAAVPGYSFLWCVARELTDKDWMSQSAENFTLAFAFAISAFAVSAFAFAVSAFAAFAVSAFAFAFAAFAAFAFAVAASAAIAAFAFAVFREDHDNVSYYILRFPGAAWNHYVVDRRNRS